MSQRQSDERVCLYCGDDHEDGECFGDAAGGIAADAVGAHVVPSREDKASVPGLLALIERAHLGLGEQDARAYEAGRAGVAHQGDIDRLRVLGERAQQVLEAATPDPAASPPGPPAPPGRPRRPA